METKLLDTIKLTNRLNSNFACGYSDDDRIFIICDAGVYILTMKSLITNPFPTFSARKDFFKVSNYDISSNVEIDINTFNTTLDRDDLYESVLRTELSTNLKHSSGLELMPIKAEWSPKGIVGKTECLLAVLTNLYSLEIYVRIIDENELTKYVSIGNISQETVVVQKMYWNRPEPYEPQARYQEYKQRIESVTPTTFTWSHLFKTNDITCAVMFVGHMNGSVDVWRIHERKASSEQPSDFCFLGRHETQLQNICSLNWHQTREAGGTLAIGDTEGRMSFVNISNLDSNEMLADHEISFWSDPDNIKVDKITVMNFKGHTFVILIKQSFIIVYAINKDGLVHQQTIYHVGNYYTTGVYHYDNILFVLTLTGILKLLRFYIVDEKLCIAEEVVDVKVDLNRFRTHGMFFSKNRVLIGILAYPSRMRDIISDKQGITMFILHNNDLKPFELLMSNTKESLIDYWDCFEALRLICLKEKRFPWQGINPKLNYDNLSLIQLKSLRLVAKLSEEIFNIVPKIVNYDIKPYVLLHYVVDIKLAVQRLNKLISQRNSGMELTTFQMQSIDVQNFFLKEMIVKDILAKANLGETFVDELYHIMSIANELRYPQMPQCFWCGEKIIGLTCLPPHADSRCAISMMPISIVPGYKCYLCKALAHKEMDNEFDVVHCPYCDVPMVPRHIEDTVRENVDKTPLLFKHLTEAAYGINGYPEITSPCCDDCVKDGIEFEDIEDVPHDYAVFSDSDDEQENTDKDKLRELYFGLYKMTVDDNVEDNNSEEQQCTSAKLIKMEQS